MATRPVDVIARKRDGHELTTAEIDGFVDGFTRGEIPDYQAAAWLMAVVWRGMSARETADLTAAMVRGGVTLDLGSLREETVDKHSTGGVGDKTTLVVAPIVAACGLRVGKMSGRGLGFSGGTLDKLEAIRGFRVSLTQREFLDQLARIGIVLAGQSADLAPADGQLYALRDVTATVESIPLIASSIMSKKIAAGASAIVLDVKFGRGAFMKEIEAAQTLASAMVEIGRHLGRRMAAVLSSMEQPLGTTIGNALEVREAVATLRGEGPADITELGVALSARMLVLGGRATRGGEAEQMARAALADGRAFDKLVALCRAQGGDDGVLRDVARLPRAPHVATITSPGSGYVASIDPEALAWVSVGLGAGRVKKGDAIDHSVGLVLRAKVGDRLTTGAPLVEVHAAGADDVETVRDRILAAYTWSDRPVTPPRLIAGVID